MNLNNGIIDQFNFPGINTAEILKSQNLEARTLDSSGPGQAAQFLAHDKGTAYRFFIHADHSKEMSRVLKYPHYNNLIMIEWFVRKDFKPIERVHLLPEGLLEFEKDIQEIPTSDGKGIKEKVTYGECIGGLYAEAFKRWKEGAQAPGMPLSKWGILDDGQVATLSALGVFSVEQLASMPRSKFNNPNMPAEFLEALDQAIQYVSGKINHAQDERLAKELLEVQQESRSKDARLRELEIQMRELMSFQGGSKANKKTTRKKRGPNKAKVVAGEIQLEEEE